MTLVGKTEVKGELKKAISDAVLQIGGFGEVVKNGDIVLLKPNFNTADVFPGSTDLEFLKTVVELVYETGAKMVLIGESSTVTANTRKIMEKLGVFKLAEMETPPRIYMFEQGFLGEEVLDFSKSSIKWVKKDIPGAKYLKSVSVPNLLDKVDKLILLPCLKTHKYAKFTGALKLSMGFVKPPERIKMHLSNLQEKIVDLNLLIKPDLVIMDGRKCFISGGPDKGELREPNLILASKSRVAIDIEGIKIIQSFSGNSLAGIDPYELPQIKTAIELRIDQ